MRSRMVRWVALVAIGAPPLLACAVFDAFAPAGPRDVTFSYIGPTLLRAGDRSPFAVTASAGGSVLADPRLRVTVLDSTIVSLTASGDSLVALKSGRTDLSIALQNSLLTGNAPDTVIALRVFGGGPPVP